MPNLLRRDFKGYLISTEQELLTRIAEISMDIFHLEQELALSLSAEYNAKVLSFFEDKDASSLTLREWIAKRQALDATTESMTIKGDLAALKLELDVVKLFLERRFAS